MKIVRYTDAGDFLARAEGFLVAREAEHNLILGLAGRLRVEPLRYGYPAYLATVERGGDVVSVAMRMPPLNLIISETGDEEAVDAIAADVRSDTPRLPGLLAPKAVGARFVEVWEQLTGVSTELVLAERIHRAQRARLPEGVSGRMREYGRDDRELMLAWFGAFVEEALPPGQSPEEAADILERRLAEPEGGIVVWEDEEPVTVAGFGGPTPNGIRVGPVYTPPELRRRGYATALVAALTQKLLERHRFCCLFTDLANPTSNSIYARVGYEPVTDVDQWAFE
jgi:predicted GNAT family acetyltransferase